MSIESSFIERVFPFYRDSNYIKFSYFWKSRKDGVIKMYWISNARFFM